MDELKGTLKGTEAKGDGGIISPGHLKAKGDGGIMAKGEG